MKIVIIVSIASVAMAFSGCTKVVSDINSVTAALSSPAANQAAANLKAGAQAVACSVSDVDALVEEIENGVTLPKAYAAVVIRDTNSVYAVSADACTFLGGTPGAAATVPAGSTVIVPSAS